MYLPSLTNLHWVSGFLRSVHLSIIFVWSLNQFKLPQVNLQLSPPYPIYLHSGACNTVPKLSWPHFSVHTTTITDRSCYVTDLGIGLNYPQKNLYLRRTTSTILWYPANTWDILQHLHHLACNNMKLIESGYVTKGRNKPLECLIPTQNIWL